MVIVNKFITKYDKSYELRLDIEKDGNLFTIFAYSEVPFTDEMINEIIEQRKDSLVVPPPPELPEIK